MIVAQPGLDTPARLKGKPLGTFQMDTLEVLPYDWLKKNVAFNEITVRYMGNTPEAVEASRPEPSISSARSSLTPRVC